MYTLERCQDVTQSCRGRMRGDAGREFDRHACEEIADIEGLASCLGLDQYVELGRRAGSLQRKLL